MHANRKSTRAGSRPWLIASVLVLCAFRIFSASSQEAPLAVERSVIIPVVEANDIPFTRLAANSGLSQDRVSHIVQDNQGFMWFGTQYGLNRFDGYSFKVFAHNPKNAASLGGVYIKALFKDRTGALWVGCDQVLDRFDPVTETFVHYTIRAREGPNPTIHSITEDDAGKLWLATDTGLLIFNPISGVSTRFQHEENGPETLSINDIKYAGVDSEENVWIANDLGLDAYNRITGRRTHHIALSESRELSFFEDRSGNFWIYHASGSGLASYNRKANILTRYRFDDREPFVGGNLGVSSILEDRMGTMWFSTNGSGLLKLDQERNRFVRYKHNAGDPQSLATDAIVMLFEDRDGNIWTALHGMQVNVFSPRQLPFKKLTYGPPPLQSRGGTMVNAVFEDSRGVLWVSYVGMLSQVDRLTGTRVRFPAISGGIADDVLTMIEDPHGRLWFGTTGAGLVRFDPRNGRSMSFRHDTSRPSSISNDEILRLMIDHRGALWAATWEGVNRYDEATGQFHAYRRLEAKRSEHYLALVEDASGLIWLGGNDSGLQALDPASGEFLVYEHDPSRANSLSNNRVNSVYIDSAQRLWVGTQQGLNLFDRKTGTFTAFYDSDGIAGNVVSCIQGDEQGNLWMSTNRGISRFEPDSRRFINYTGSDGLPGPDMTGWGSCAKSRRGEMFFGGYAGATAFFPSDVSNKALKPSIVFTEFDLAGVSVSIGGSSPLHKAIGYTDEVKLSHEQNSFAVAFSALSFRSAESTRYRYRLQDLEKDWQEVGGDRRLASYTTVPAGKYQLIAESAIGGGPWSEPSTLRVSILPPWWATWWFRSAAISAIFMLLLFGYFVRMGQLKQEIRRRLELRHAERETIARDLHDTLLQTIQGSKLVVDGSKDLDPSRIKESLEKVSHWLGRAMDEGRAALESLRGFSHPTEELAESLKRSAEECAPESMQVDLFVTGDVRPLHPIVRNEIYRIASEAVRNACSHSGASLMTIQVKYGKDLTVRVADNGRGFEPKLLLAGKPGHFGIAGMKERAGKIGARFSLRTEAGKGTDLVLEIPNRIIYGRHDVVEDPDA